MVQIDDDGGGANQRRSREGEEKVVDGNGIDEGLNPWNLVGEGGGLALFGDRSSGLDVGENHND